MRVVSVKSLGLLGQYLAVAVILGGLSARHVPPEVIWPLQVLGVGLPYLAVPFAVLAIANVVWGRRRERWVFGAMLAVLVLRFGLPLPTPGVKSNVETLSVLTFNGKPESAADQVIQDYLDLIGDWRPEIVALQQVEIRQNRPETGLEIDARYVEPLLTRGYSIPDGHPTRDRPPIQVPIITTLDWLAFTDSDLPGTNDLNRETRSYTRAEVLWHGDSVAVYNVHLHSFGSYRPWKAKSRRERFSPLAWGRAIRSYGVDFQIRAEQARALRSILDSEELPFILCGDLNSTPHDWVHGHISRGYQDVYAASRVSGWGATYHAKFPLFRIDHIIASREWTVVEAQVLRQPRSDHLPLLARLALG